MDLNAKHRIVKLLEENLQELRVGEELLNVMLKL
jgi:hypothetical protein